MGKSANKKKVILPIRTIVPRVELKPNSTIEPPAKLENAAKRKNGAKPKSKRRARLDLPAEHITDTVLDRLYEIVLSRRAADPSVSHSARLLSRGTAKVAQKFGEEAVECLIEAVAGNHDALVSESADVLYHLLVLWVASGVEPAQVWAELARREGVSGITEKASRAYGPQLARRLNTSKIP